MNIINGLFYFSTLAIAMNLVAIVLKQPTKYRFVLIINSLLWVLSSSIVLIYLGFIIDELNLSGNPMHFYLTLLNGVLFLASLFIFSKQISKQNNQHE